VVDRSIVVRLRADIADFKRSLGEASKATDDVGAKAQATAKKADTAFGQMMQSASNHKEAWTQVGGALTGIGAAAAVGVGAAVSKFADFDAAISGVQAATHETAANMDLLRQAALDAGAETAFSATEAAGAVEELAKAGIQTKDVLGGGLSGALSLAAAGSMDVADAAETAASAMTQFGLSGEDVPHIADLLAAAAGKAQGSVADMGAALNQTGLVADATGLSIEETTAGLAAFASAGLVGSDAGTSFKSMLQRLTPQSQEAAGLMSELGINAYDAQGNFIGLANFAGNLRSALEDLTPEQRNSAMATIFGSDAVRASNVLYEQGAEGIREWTAAVDDSGFAAETAAIKTDNLRGDMERLGGSFDTALIQSGSAANDMLRSITQTLTGTVDAFNAAPESVQTATLVFGAATSAVGLLGGGFLLAAPRILETRKAIDELGQSMPKTTTAMTGLAKAAGAAAAVYALGTAVGALGDAQAPATTGIEGTTEALLDLHSASDTVAIDALFRDFNQTGTLFGEAQGHVTDFRSAVDSVLGEQNQIENFFSSVFGYSTERSKSVEQIGQMGSALAALVNEGHADLAASRFDKLAASLEGAGYSTEQIMELMPAYGEALSGAANSQELATESTEAATDAVVEQVDALAELIGSQGDLAGVVLSARDAQRQFEDAIASATDAVEENGRTLDITTEAGRANQAALDDVASAGWDVIESMQANGATQAQLQGTMAATRERFIGAATAMGMSADEANALADELRLIPTSVTAAVSVETVQAQANIDRLIAQNNGKRINLVVEATGSGASYVGASYRTAAGTVMRASGGPVYGPGTATSDSIPAWLSNGEYVIKASAVDRYGTAFFDSLNSQRFASGGLVGGASPGAAVSQAGEVPPIYVQNPFTGEYLLAQVDDRAAAQATHAVRLATSGRPR
jgi:TP901 family phage tail tape measure protein